MMRAHQLRPTLLTAEVTNLHDAPCDRLIQVFACGTWTEQQVEDHFTDLNRRLRRVRERCASIPVLVDLRLAAVQSQPVFDRLAWWTARLYTPEDRVAILLASSLLKSQMRRIEIDATRELFLSFDAALSWLIARKVPTLGR
jgi:hypothetical protein